MLLFFELSHCSVCTYHNKKKEIELNWMCSFLIKFFLLIKKKWDSLSKKGSPSPEKQTNLEPVYHQLQENIMSHEIQFSSGRNVRHVMTRKDLEDQGNLRKKLIIGLWSGLIWRGRDLRTKLQMIFEESKKFELIQG